MNFHKIIHKYSDVFWDFDGVIKDSIDIKNNAFLALFKCCSTLIKEKISIHHMENGGMSRYEKFPLYLEWSGETVSEEKIRHLDKQFESMVIGSVVNSKWIPGIESFLRENKYNQKFYLVSATPQMEIEEIAKSLNIASNFQEICGSPKDKVSAIADILDKYALKNKNCVMIGDAIHDYEAAKKNDISFILKINGYNRLSFNKYNGYQVENFE